MIIVQPKKHLELPPVKDEFHLINKIFNIHHKEKAMAKVDEKPREEFVFNFCF